MGKWKIIVFESESRCTHLCLLSTFVDSFSNRNYSRKNYISKHEISTYMILRCPIIWFVRDEKQIYWIRVKTIVWTFLFDILSNFAPNFPTVLYRSLIFFANFCVFSQYTTYKGLSEVYHETGDHILWK